jgi:hypothetical protein
VSRLFPHQLDVHRFEQTNSDAMATERTVVNPPEIEGMECNIQPLSVEEQDQYERIEDRSTYKIFTDVDLDNVLVPSGGLRGINQNYILHDPVLGDWYIVRTHTKRSNPTFTRPLQYKIIADRQDR